MRILVRDLPAHIGKTVTVCGWVNALRLQRKMQFLILRDSTGMVQVTHRRNDEADPLEQLIEELTDESAIRVTGTAMANEIVNLAGLEIIPDTIEVLGRAETPLPIDRNSGPEHRLDWRYLDLRLRPEQRLILEVQSTVAQAMREYVFAHGFTEIYSPKLMGTASESGAEVFQLDYFGRPAYLAQSPQFYKQMAIAAGIDRVFEIGPVFRAEPSFTSRHATEFTSVDIEMAFIEDVDEVMSLEEAMLAHVVARVNQTYGADLEAAFGATPTVPSLPFPQIPMAEVIAILRAEGWDPSAERDDLDPDGERRICAHVLRELGHEFVFVTRYPISVRPFYHMRPADAPTEALSFDLLWKGLEITTGAQREHRYDVLCAQAIEKGMRLEPLSDYLNAFRHGMPPHGGFAIGIGRLVMTMLGLGSFRDVTFLFRGPNRLSP